MRIFAKRALSLMLALVLCVGLLSGVTFPVSAATVDYVYGSPAELDKYSNVIYNWGTRGEVATFLSPNAEKFYTDNDVTYSELSRLAGSSTTSVYTSELYVALKALVTDNQTVVTSYDDTRYLYRFTDCQGSGIENDSISCFYSGADIGPDWDSGSTWNREHTWPNSKGDKNGNGENDIMMLRPASTTINSSRGNKAYGDVTSTSYYSPNNEAGGQYDLRGDVARVILYVYTRWPSNQTTDYMWGASGVIESKEVLLKWMEEDPVDTWEMGRNDSVESITGTRNVYVDYPELAFLLFNEDVPATMQTPSGGEDVVPTYTVTAVSNNNSYGTVSLNENVITATPAAGYYVDSYTVTSGQATVAQEGNVFTVTPTSNCTVQINFAATPVQPVDAVKVAYHNVYFDEYLQIMYAVYVPDGETVEEITLTDGVNSFYAVPYTDDKPVPQYNGKDCQLFVADTGVSLQNMDTVVTAEVYVDGEVAATDTYSILQYLHKRLVIDDLTGKAAEKAMYERLLNLAEKMQVVLNNGVVTVHNTGYVYVVNGTVDGTRGDAMVAVGEALSGVTSDLIPGANQQVTWTVTTYNDAGVADGFQTMTTEQVRAIVVQEKVNLKLEAALKGDGTAESGYYKVTDSAEIAAGGEFIIGANHNDNWYAVGKTISNSKAVAESLAVSGNAASADAPVWTITPVAGGVTVKDSETGKYLTGSTSGTTVSLGTTEFVWTIETGAEAECFYLVAGSSTRYLAYSNTNSVFGSYSATSANLNSSTYQFDLCFFKLSDDTGVEPDPTEPTECEHTDTRIEGKVDATCTDAGSTGTTICNDCGETVKAATVIPATGEHTYVDGICSVCGDEQPVTGEPTTVSVTMANNGWTNSTKYTTLALDGNITASVTGGGNTGKYYTSDNTWRIYQNENPTLTISAASGTIKSVKITYTISNSGTLKLNGSNVKSNDVVTVNAASVTFNVGNTGSATNGQVKVTAIEVVYEGGASAASLSNYATTPFHWRKCF